MSKDTEKQEPKTLDEIKQENEALYTQLTKKNQNYLFRKRVLMNFLKK